MGMSIFAILAGLALLYLGAEGLVSRQFFVGVTTWDQPSGDRTHGGRVWYKYA